MSAPVGDHQQEATAREWPAIRRGPIGATGVVIAAGSCVLFAGQPGVVAGVGVLVGGLLLPAPVAFGVALAGVLLLAEPASLVGVGVGATLMSIFVDVAITYPQPVRRHILIGMLTAGLILGAVTATTVGSWPLGQVSGVVGVTIGGSIYVFHRLTRVKLGLETERE